MERTMNSTSANNSATRDSNKPPVYLSNPRPQLKRPLESATATTPFPPNHPLANFPLPTPTPYQQQQAARLQYFHTREPVYVNNPTFGLKDFELQDTLGMCLYISFSVCFIYIQYNIVYYKNIKIISSLIS